MYSKNEKRQRIIFVAVAYGITYLLGLLMWYGYAKQIDLSAFPNAQMMYPAMGVMLAVLLTRREDKDIPKAFYISFIASAVLQIVLAILSVFRPDMTVEMSGGTVSVWLLILQYVQIIGSIISLICLFIAGKKKREAYGLRWKNWKSSVFCIVLFLVLYFSRVALAYALEGQLSVFFDIMKRAETWTVLAVLPLNFLLAYSAFFGEEYGWRYYLQPMLQRKFGLRKGVLLLGVVWGIWHLPLDFLFYVTPDKGFIMLVSQLITCITLGIFFGYAYMKTGNIWVPTLLHFFNNNLILVTSGEYSVDVLQDQSVSWGDVPVALLINGLIFGLFILTKPYREKKEASEMDMQSVDMNS